MPKLQTRATFWHQKWPTMHDYMATQCAMSFNVWSAYATLVDCHQEDLIKILLKSFPSQHHICPSLSLSWLVISPVGSWPEVHIFSGIPLNLSKWHAKTAQLHQPNHPQETHSKFLPNSTSLVLAWSRRRHDSGNHPQLLWPRIWICVPAPESTLEISQAPKPRQPSLVTLQGRLFRIGPTKIHQVREWAVIN